MSLEQQLEKIRQFGKEKLPPEVFRQMQEGTDKLRNSGIMDKVVRVGSSLPTFRLKNQNGVEIASDEILENGALILTVFRGHW
tara:strand:- start:597 stop:845 length:249 start_codon:yes stop_codon:yes gene_type:complete